MSDPFDEVALPVRDGRIKRFPYAQIAGINHGTIQDIEEPGWDCSPKVLRKLQRAKAVIDSNPGKYPVPSSEDVALKNYQSKGRQPRIDDLGSSSTPKQPSGENSKNTRDTSEAGEAA